jgi:hypothetical protein
VRDGRYVQSDRRAPPDWPSSPAAAAGKTLSPETANGRRGQVQRLVLRLECGSCSKWAARQGSMRYLPSGHTSRNRRPLPFTVLR